MRFIDLDTVLFNRYKITEELGGGGQSFVYKAEDSTIRLSTSWKKTVFIKQYSGMTNVAEHFPLVQNHYKEISKRLKEISNFICLPNDIQISEPHSSIIAIFPFVQGTKLSDKIKDMVHEERVRIAFAIVNTFRKIHEEGIAHLDLKPDNIVVYNEPTTGKVFIKLIDLDGSKIDGKSILENDIKTPGYGSPEHFSNASLPTGLSSDIFSLGITLIELLTHNYPFKSTGTYLQDANLRHYTIRSTPIHIDIIRVLLSCLDMNPKNRPTAGYILSVFNKYHDCNFITSFEDEKWNPEKINLQIEISIQDAAIPFSRSYDTNKIFSSTDLRGAGITNLSGELFALIFQEGNCYINLLDRKAIAYLGELKLSYSKFYRLLSKQTFTIDGNVFSIRMRNY